MKSSNKIEIKEKMANKFGILEKHQYFITEAITFDSVRYVQVYNPHNTPDEIKRYKAS